MPQMPHMESLRSGLLPGHARTQRRNLVRRYRSLSVLAVCHGEPAIKATPSAKRPVIQQRHQQIADCRCTAHHLARATLLVVAEYEWHLGEGAPEQVELDDHLERGC